MFDTSDFTLTAYTASDGENLAVYDWPLADGRPQRGTVLLVHGLGEHAGRYHAVAHHLNAWGFAVRAYDQYGHGQSDGPRGGLNHDMRLLDDLADMVDATRARTPEGLPLVLLGHSMGGLVAARFVAMHLRPVDALVLSSPALDPGLNAVQKVLLATLPGVAPNLRISNGLDAQYLSHDPTVVPATVARAAHWSVPTLLMWAGDDRLVQPAGSAAFAAAAPRGVVESRCFESLWHELFNEQDAAPVFAALRQWLDARFPLKTIQK